MKRTDGKYLSLQKIENKQARPFDVIDFVTRLTRIIGSTVIGRETL